MAGTILVADDNLTNQRTATEMLTQEGFEVVTVGNGMAALKKLSTLRPLVVLADVDMPGKDGYEVCEFVKHQPELSSVRVLLAVNDTDPYDQQRGARARADGIVKKPFDRKELVSVIIRYANEYEAQQRREEGMTSGILSSWSSETSQEAPFPIEQSAPCGTIPEGLQVTGALPATQPAEGLPWMNDAGGHQSVPTGAPGLEAKAAEIGTANENPGEAPEISFPLAADQGNPAPYSELHVNSSWEGAPIQQSNEAPHWSLPSENFTKDETPGLEEHPSSQASTADSNLPQADRTSEELSMSGWELPDTSPEPFVEPFSTDLALEGASSASQYEEMVQSIFLHHSTTAQVSAPETAGGAKLSGGKVTPENALGSEDPSPISSISNQIEISETGSATPSHSGALDYAFISSIVHKVVLCMSPPVLSPDMIQSLERKIIQEITSELATPPEPKGSQ
jgi:CheY-like chemotaxis protein